MVALQYIKKANPSLEIDWIIEEGFASMLEGNLDINTILTLNLKKIKKDKKEIFNQLKIVKKYAKNKYDLIIDAQGLLKSAIVSKILGKNRVGFSKESIREGVASYFYTKKVEIAYSANTIDRNAKVLSEPLGVEITSQMIMEKKPFLFYDEVKSLDSYLAQDKKNIIFIIGSTWESRNYPKEKFLAVANGLKQNILIAWGSKEEQEKAQWLEKSSNFITMLPKINLNGLKYIIASSNLLIGNDTGPTHIAWGLNIPSITLFGCTPINRVYETPINKVIKSDSIVNHYKLDKNDFSIRDIDEDDVIKLAEGLLYD